MGLMRRFTVGEGGYAEVVCVPVMAVLVLASVVGAATLATSIGGVDGGQATSGGDPGVALTFVAVGLASFAGSLLVLFRPFRWPFGDRDRPTVDLQELTTDEMRRAFRRAVEYHREIDRVVCSIDDRHLRSQLRRPLRDIDRPTKTMFKLAKQLESYGEDRLLVGDLVRLRDNAASLTAEEQVQLDSLERLDGAARIGNRLIREMLAILGRCYAQTREVALIRDLEIEPAHLLIEQLREQAAGLHQLSEALHEVYAGDTQRDGGLPASAR